MVPVLLLKKNVLLVREKVKIKKNKTIEIKFLLVQITENRLRVAGRGEAGSNGGNNGDLYVEFTVRDHEFFVREEDDIYIELPLTITEAALGCKKEVPTLYGNINLISSCWYAV